MTLIPGLLAACTLLEPIAVPLASPEDWLMGTYRGIAANEVSFSPAGLRIVVKQSASPLMFGFKQPVRACGLRASATWEGTLNISSSARQGDPGQDDFVLKIGLVVAGQQRLSPLQYWFAPAWLRQLQPIVGADGGIDHVHFLTTTHQPALLGDARRHPANELLYEERVVVIKEPGRFIISHDFELPMDILGVWISSDGDDTRSAFAVTIEGLEILTDNSD